MDFENIRGNVFKGIIALIVLIISEIILFVCDALTLIETGYLRSILVAQSK